MITRRTFVTTGAAGLGLGFAPRIAFARAATSRRFVFVIQRGAADGLATVAPVGDPAFAAQRGVLAEDFAAAPRLDAMFALHPQMPQLLSRYQSGEALFAHAVASPYRDRSHFDGQNVLETGGNVAYALREGWMNRLLGLLPAAQAKAIAISATVPVVLRGSHEVGSYAPSALPDASDDLLGRVTNLYAGDPALHATWAQAMQTRTMAGDLSAGGGANAAATGALAARLLTGADGARLAVIESGGWDTHANQRGRLGFQLRGLDAMVAALKAGLGDAWRETLVIVATEFGRTAAPNGTGGTDHGTGSMAMLLGGAVVGGRVLGDWPGLTASSLYEGRDLKPTTDLDALIAAAVAEHYRLDRSRATRALFPNIATAPRLEGFVRT